MLKRSFPMAMRSTGPARQQGVVLMIALIMLVAMTLAGIALVRSTDTTNIIAGNLAFKQGATSSGDRGTEAAINWLAANSSGTALHSNDFANGYAATRASASAQTWDAFWTNTLAGQAKQVGTTEDAAGNTVWYAIERLCNATGDPVSTGVDCSVPQTVTSTSGSSKGAGFVALNYNSQIFYRVTSRVLGPRNTVSYIQAIVAL